MTLRAGKLRCLCPICLDERGRKELADPKYAINASKYLGLGDSFRHLAAAAAAAAGDEDAKFDPQRANSFYKEEDSRERNSVCMRTRSSREAHRFSVAELLHMAPLKERHPDLHTRAQVSSAADSQEREAHWELDPASGILCPPPPGDVVPITELPPDHPAVTYLIGRGFDLPRLWEQFRCSFCVREYPHGKNGIFYRSMPGGWRDTPQHRIIFYALHNGVPLTWQARYIDFVTPDSLNKYALHPYTGQWNHVETRSSSAQAWMPVAPFNEVDSGGVLKWLPSKYRTAKYSSRELMGWDAALKRSMDDEIPWCVLVEGPLDAARVGPGGIAVIGSSLNSERAAKIASNFVLVFTGFDTDLAGRQATEKITKALHGAAVRNPMLDPGHWIQLKRGDPQVATAPILKAWTARAASALNRANFHRSRYCEFPSTRGCQEGRTPSARFPKHLSSHPVEPLPHDEGSLRGGAHFAAHTSLLPGAHDS